MNVPKLRFPDFEGVWEKFEFGDIVEFSSGGTPAKSIDAYWGGEIPWISAASMHSDVITSSERMVTELGSQNGTRIASRGTVLVLVRGSMLYNRIPAGICQRDVTFNQDVKALKPKSGETSQFLLTYLRANEPKLLAMVTGTGIGAGKLDTDELKAMVFNRPSLPEQKKIAAFLGAVDAKIAGLKARQEGLERYKRGLMQALFSQRLRFTKPDGTAFPDWEEKRFSEFLVPNFRAVAKPLNEYLAIGIRSHGRGTFQKPNSDPDKIAMDTLYIVRENDLIVNITFAWEGAIAIVPKRDDGGHVSHRFPTYEFKDHLVGSEYFQIVISDLRFRRKLDLISPGGAGRNRVMSKPDFLKLSQLFPTRAEQAKIADALGAMDVKIAAVAGQVAKMEEFKKGLLQQMFV